MSALMIVFVSLLGSLLYIFGGMVMYHYARIEKAWERSDRYGQRRPDRGDWSYASGTGFWMGLLWPFALLSKLAYLLAPTPPRMREENAKIEAQKAKEKTREQEEEIQRLTRINAEMDKILVRP